MTLTENILSTNKFGDTYLYAINRGTFDKISANVVFETTFSKSLLQEDTLNIIIGTDSGLLPKYITEQGIPSGSRYIFIETQDILDTLNQHHLLGDFPTEIACLTADEWLEKASDFKIDQYLYIGAVKSFNSICAQQFARNEYAELSWTIKETLHTLHWQHNAAIGNESFIIRQLENATDNLLPAGLLKNAFKNQTVIILAGGPSLSNILPWVKQNRSKLTVFSVSRISRQLVANGINPDFVFSVDPQAISTDYSKEMFQFGSDTIFIHAYHVHPRLLNQWPYTSLYLGERLPWKSIINPENLDSIGPTVTNTALNTAYFFGFERILLAGFDLCYTKEGITHAKGSNEQLAGPKYKLTSLQVETYNGEKRPTGQDFYTALEVLSQQAEIITADQRKIINLAPTAAKARTIEHIPPEKIELTEIEIAPIDIVAKHIPKVSDTDLKEDFEALTTELKKALHQISNIKKLANKAIEINNRMYNKEGLIENYRDKRNLDIIEKQLNRRYKVHGNLVKRFGLRNFLKITAPHKSDWNAEKAKDVGLVYYQSYLTGAKHLIELIEDTLQRTQTRQEEQKNNPNFTMLFTQWNKDQCFNRARIWLKNHPNTHLPEPIATEFESFSEKFDAFIKNDASKRYAQNRTVSRLPDVKARALLLLKHKKNEELHDLLNALTIDDKEPNKASYLKLISAFIAEIEENYDIALGFYDEILNYENSPLLEEALLRIALISINQQNNENAFLALECLSQLSPLYLPFYAESARILGQLMIAIDSYNAYIAQFPNDTSVKLKLANLYLENRIPDAAEMMIDHILEQKPDLPAALTLKKIIAEQKQS